ncbi:MAG: flagellar hook-basal body complex protein FliE [Melioribacteraceae bacterium]|nr:flagellar hook-basal body complex protein FliE [Melioribacteraceae bacterium]
MKIQGFSNLAPDLVSQAKKNIPVSGFAETLNNLVQNVNETQKASEQSVQNFVSGNGIELHEVMIAGEKAKTNLALLMEIRNKTIDMYKELTRIPL